MKRIAVLGSTGSIGRSALSVVATHSDKVEVVGLAAGGNIEKFVEQVRVCRPTVFTMASESALEGAYEVLGAPTGGLPAGNAGLVELATHPDVDLVLCATAGTAGLDAVFAAIQAGKTIALANKEVLVMAGALMMRTAENCGATILPVDSEHNAIHQCLAGTSRDDLQRIILTASGGPFRGWSLDELRGVTSKQALEHPTWNMGPKITIDSSTLMNKGLEVIEARWLFDVLPEKIDVVVHPQSVVHSLIELRDGSVIAQMGITDMRLPIQYAFSYPERWETSLPALDLTACGQLEFDSPDLNRFPCLGLAYQALKGGPDLPVVLNAVNEVAVEAFLAKRIRFLEIPEIIEQSLEASEKQACGLADTLEEIREVDSWARRFSQDLVVRLESS